MLVPQLHPEVVTDPRSDQVKAGQGRSIQVGSERVGSSHYTAVSRAQFLIKNSMPSQQIKFDAKKRSTHLSEFLNAASKLMTNSIAASSIQ